VKIGTGKFIALRGAEKVLARRRRKRVTEERFSMVGICVTGEWD